MMNACSLTGVSNVSVTFCIKNNQHIDSLGSMFPHPDRGIYFKDWWLMIRAIKRLFKKKNSVCVLTLSTRINHSDIDKMIDVLYKMGAR